MTWDYISGFFDADGSITVSRIEKGKPKTVQLSFHNTKLEVLKVIQAFIFSELGIKGFISTKPAKKDNHQDSYDLKYTRFSKCLPIINNLNSFHPMKNHRMKLISQIYEYTPRNGKYTQETINKRDSLIEEFFSL